MSSQKFTNTPRTRHESLYDLHFLSFWSQSGSDWSSTIKEELQAATNQPIEEEESNFTSKVVLVGVLAILALLVAAMWSQAPEIYQAVQEVGKNSVEQVISTD